MDRGELGVAVGRGSVDVLKLHAADGIGRFAALEVRLGLCAVSSQHWSGNVSLHMDVDGHEKRFWSVGERANVHNWTGPRLNAGHIKRYKMSTVEKVLELV